MCLCVGLNPFTDYVCLGVWLVCKHLESVYVGGCAYVVWLEGVCMYLERVCVVFVACVCMCLNCYSAPQVLGRSGFLCCLVSS